MTDYGSDILSSAAYAGAVKDLLNVELNERVRTYLKATDDEFRTTALSFAPLATGLRKIFTFYETKESQLNVIAANAAGKDETTVSYMVRLQDKFLTASH